MSFLELDGVRYVRISCQIYNELNDYKLLAEAVLLGIQKGLQQQNIHYAPSKHQHSWLDEAF